MNLESIRLSVSNVIICLVCLLASQPVNRYCKNKQTTINTSCLRKSVNYHSPNAQHCCLATMGGTCKVFAKFKIVYCIEVLALCYGFPARISSFHLSIFTPNLSSRDFCGISYGLLAKDQMAGVRPSEPEFVDTGNE